MKLLNKSIRSYLIYSTAIFLLVIPVFYYAIHLIVSEDADQTLMKYKQETIARLNQLDSSQLEVLESLNLEPGITPIQQYKPFDTLYTIDSTRIIPSLDSMEIVPFRVLESNILVKGKPYRIRLKNSLIEDDNLIESIVLVMVIMLLLIIAGIFIINRIISKKIWTPFYNTLRKLDKYEIEKSQPLALDKTNIDEFNRLNFTIEALTKRSEQVYQLQKEFTENSSHEMQTPLAILQGKLELLMQTGPLTSEQGELISDLGGVTKRLNRLNRSLLLLTKIESKQFLDKEKLSLRMIIIKILEQYAFQIAQKKIHVQTFLDRDVIIEANKSLTEVLMSNLISNAIRYNTSNGRIIIKLSENNFEVQNTGKAHQLDGSKIFQRFYKESPDGKGLGLGLELIRKISSLYNIKVEYRYSEKLHSFILKTSDN